MTLINLWGFLFYYMAIIAMWKGTIMWVQINEEYLNYLREHGDTRVPNQDYDEHKFKPFFPVIEIKKIQELCM